jgi:hypothetical protein
MTGDEFKAIRFKLGLSGLEWGRMLGYARKPHNVRVQVRRWEQEVRPIPPWIAPQDGDQLDTAVMPNVCG